MRFAFVGLLLAACSSHSAVNLLCTYCETDEQCHGNPCFEDVSGQRFCGKPCDSGCPSGTSCQPVAGSHGTISHTCFPDSEACLPPGDMGPVGPGADLFGLDLTTQPLPMGGPISVTGGTVDRLLFGFTGDTRPTDCDGAYPQAIANNIFTELKGKDVQFALDQGDHMFSCQGGYPGAAAQMNDYLTAASLMGKTLFMTMGNHECTNEATTLCTLASYGKNTNYTAYMDAMKKLGFTQPYYRFDVMTSTGLAVFLVVADDTWDATEQAWLTTQLTDADTNAKYTFVSKHHPDGNTDHVEFQQIYDLVTSHKYTLFFTGHTHEYRHDRRNARSLIIGCGGAPLAGAGFFGFGTAIQGPDDRIYVTVYDQSTGDVMDQFDVAPQ